MERRRFIPQDIIRKFTEDTKSPMPQDRPLIPPRPRLLEKNFELGIHIEGESIIRLSLFLSGIVGFAKLIERHLN